MSLCLCVITPSGPVFDVNGGNAGTHADCPDGALQRCQNLVFCDSCWWERVVLIVSMYFDDEFILLVKGSILLLHFVCKACHRQPAVL